MTTSTLDVSDLFSVLGVHGIKRQLQRVAAVDRVWVNPVAGSTTVVYDPARTSLPAIQAEIRGLRLSLRGQSSTQTSLR